MSKVCPKCRRDDVEFYSNTRWCKECSKEAARARYHRRRAADPERSRRESAASSRAYYARIRAEGGSLHERLREESRLRTRRWRGADSWHDVLLEDPCSYCGVPATQVDHIDPRVAGGGSEWTNLTAACTSCNCTKRATPLLLFLLSR